MALLTLSASKHGTSSRLAPPSRIEMYPGSYVNDVMLGRALLRCFIPNVLVERITVWKTNNARAYNSVQLGTYATLLTLPLTWWRHSLQVQFPRTAHLSALQQSIWTSLWPLMPLLMHTYQTTPSSTGERKASPLSVSPLGNIDTFLVENIWIEELAPETIEVGMNPSTVFTDSTNKIAPIQLGSNSTIILDWRSRTLLSASLKSPLLPTTGIHTPLASEYRWSSWA